MQDETDRCWQELIAAATHLSDQLRPIIPTHVSWSVSPARRRNLFKWQVEDRLIFERDFGGPTVEISELIRRRSLPGGPWTNVATPSEAREHLLAGITAALRDGDFENGTGG